MKKLLRALKRSDLILTPSIELALMRQSNRLFSPEVADFVHKQMTTPQRNRSNSFSASSAGYCLRRQIFAYIGVPTEGVGSQLSHIFYDGTWRHLRWQALLLQENLLDQAEFPLDWPAKRSKGSMDGYGRVPMNHPNKEWRGLDFGFELKGVNPFQYNSLVKTGMIDAHKRQVHRYFLVSGVDLFVVIYEDKATQNWQEWVITPDPEWLAEQEDELDTLNQHVDDATLPAVLPECAEGKGEYKQCPYASMCLHMKSWDDAVNYTQHQLDNHTQKGS